MIRVPISPYLKSFVGEAGPFRSNLNEARPQGRLYPLAEGYTYVSVGLGGGLRDAM
jgi:hypothetical protein